MDGKQAGPPALHIAIDSTQAAIVAMPVGVLALPTAIQLRDTLLACMGAQPAAVIVDLTRLHVQASSLLTMFAVVARRSAVWTGTELVLVTGSPAIQRPAVRTAALARFIRVFPTQHAAQTAVMRTAAQRRFRVRRLEAGARAVPEARRFVRYGCRRWQCGVADDAESVGAELVGLTLRSCLFPPTVRLELRQHLLTVAVSGQDPDLTLPPSESYVEFTYAMRIVEALSCGWGSVPAPGGKTLWATLRTV
jgi:anti-anti-sigma regulatory factor